MARTNIYRYPQPDDPYNEGKQLDGWFDPATCEIFEEATTWDGHNHVSVPAGEHNHEALYRTKKGRWVLNWWSQWEGREETYRYIDDDAARDWLLKCGRDGAVEKYFGELEEESGPGRPAIGPPINLRLGPPLTARLDAARKPGEYRAEAVRRLLEKVLDSA